MPLADDPRDSPHGDMSAPTVVVPLSPAPLLVAAGTVVGRYRVVDKLATGGMGVVFRAYDPELSRHVALKIVQHGSVDLEHLATVEEYEQRLLREAQALARLSHPNVVAAFDVGRFAGMLFIAMELIDGVSVRTWLMQGPRSRDEILHMLLEAGRGLSAAHRAGVVHRDFKLSNVMVSSEGRVQVVDFGLARTAETVVKVGPDSGPPSALGGDAASRSASGDLTRSGAIMGTAGYIAPEQFESGLSDERSDQFSYASAAFRALTGHSPYPAESLAGYRAALARGERAAWPKSIPRALRRVIDRGLAIAPGDRYPSLAALLADLEKAAHPPRPLLSLLAVALGLSALASTLAVRERMVERCDVDVKSFARVWNTRQLERTRAAFAESGNPRASDAVLLIASRLDDYASRWQAARQEACVAAHVRHEQSEHVLTLRNACLDGKLAQLGTLLGLFQHADAALVDRASEAVDSISQLRDCSDVATLLGESERLPDAEPQRAQFVELGQRYDTLLTTSATGRWPELLEQAEKLARDAESVGGRAIQARAMSQALLALERLGRPEEVRELRQRTIELASDARVYDVVAYQAMRLLLRAIDGERFGEAKAMLPLVDADVRLAGRPPPLQIRLLTYEAAIFSADREWQAAIDKLELARAECRQLGTEGLRSCLGPQRELGFLHAFRKDYATAHRELTAAVELAKLAFGPRHPSVMNEYNNLAEILVRAGELDAAAQALTHSKELAATLPANRQTANIPQIEAMIVQGRGDAQAALPLFEEAARRLSEAYGERTVQAALGEYLLGNCLLSLNRPADALGHLTRSLELRRTLAAPRMLVAEASFAVAEASWSVPGQRARARQLAQQALALFEGEGSSAVEEARRGRGWIAGRERSDRVSVVVR
jgi:serine/threonine protein kinase